MRLLVIRTSAMGDVALIAPVLTAVRKQYPDIELLFLTKEAFSPFFSSINGLRLFYPDLKNRHRGLFGLLRLFIDLRSDGEIDSVVDLHDVLRSKILRLLFRIAGIKTSVIDKGRNEKKAIINGGGKGQLKHSVDRYCDVFARAGFSIKPLAGPWIFPSPVSLARADSLLGTNYKLNIGVAPYAKHKLKMWPEDYMIRLVALIKEKHQAKFWLFGGNEDLERMAVLQAGISGSSIVAGTLKLDEELALMSKMDLMIAMDSSNMHMAAMVGIKVISIWGGTDPLTGFGAWMQPVEYSVRIPVEELTCRPCTIFGKGECSRGDFACMNWLTPEMVFEKIEALRLLKFNK